MLKGFDQTTNIVLTESHERVYSMCVAAFRHFRGSRHSLTTATLPLTPVVCCCRDAPVEQEMLGLYVIRGDNMCVPHMPAPTSCLSVALSLCSSAGLSLCVSLSLCRVAAAVCFSVNLFLTFFLCSLRAL